MLEGAARAAPPPSSLSGVRNDLLRRSGKTGRQLRRTYEHIVSPPPALAARPAGARAPRARRKRRGRGGEQEPVAEARARATAASADARVSR